jgi:hypothetical protein
MMESLIENLTAAFDEFDTAIETAYTCTCDWSEYDDYHSDKCPMELRLRDIENVKLL